MLVNRVVDEAFLVKKENVKLEGVDSKGRKRVSIFGEHQASNIINKNHRVYSEEFWEDLLNRKDFIEAQNSNRLLGFIGHPDFSKSNQIDYTKFSHYTKNIYKENNIIYATDYPTSSPMGYLLTNYMLEDNIQFGISSRGYGESQHVYDGNLGKEIEIMKPGFVMEGWDFVLDPSCYIAFPKVKLESRVYLDNWMPVLSVFDRTVRESLDTSDEPKYFIEQYSWFAGQLKKYPNVAVVRDYVNKTVDKVIEDVTKKRTLGKSPQKVFYNSSSNLEKSSDNIRKHVENLERIIRKYEEKFEKLVEEVNQYRLLEDAIVGDSNNLLSDEKKGFDVGIDTLRISKDDISKINKDSKKSVSPIQMKLSEVKRMTLRELKDLGSLLAVLPSEKKHILVSAIFSDKPTEIQDALDELLGKTMVKESVIVNNDIEDDINIYGSLAYNFLNSIKKEKVSNNYSSKPFPKVVKEIEASRKVEHSVDVYVPERENFTLLQTGIDNTSLQLSNERFSEYVENMELSNVDSPVPVRSYLTVVQEYDHPASTIRLKRGEQLYYMGYFKGNWDYKLEKIAVLKLEYILFGTQQFRYITIPVKDMLNYTVVYDSPLPARDTSLPISGEIAKEAKNEESLLYLALEEEIANKEGITIG